MKQISTLLLALTSFVYSFAQSGTIYRWVGAGTTSTTNGIVGYTVNTATGVSNNNILRAANWNVVNPTTGALTAAASNPTTGATLQFFGKGINVTANIDLSAYVFNIQIRSEYNAAVATTKMNLGFIAVHGTNNSTTLTFGAGSSITLGWGLETVSGTEYWTPGYLFLYRASRSPNVVIGANPVAFVATGTTNNTTYYLNANGYTATSAATAAASNGLTAPTSAHIRNAANGPKANLSTKTTALPTAYFTQFPLFYNSAAASPTTVAPLPLQLKDFSAQKLNGKVVLNWSTIMEINTAYFELEQSNNAASWTKIATVKAAGSSLMPVQYNAEDASAYTGKSYYRLKMVDADGKTQYSPVAVVLFATAKGKVVAYPNPATSYTMISTDIAINENVIVTVMNGSGMIVKQESISKPGNSFRIGLDHLTPGAYILKITAGTSLIEIIKIQKN